MNTLKTQLDALTGKIITVWLLGGGGGGAGGAECSGTLVLVGDDFIDIDQGAGGPHWLIPLTAISAVVHRV